MRGDAMSPAALDGLKTFLIEVLRDAALEAFREAAAEERKPKFATSKHNPLGNARKFLDAGRRKAFPMRRVGRDNVALWVDVEAYMQSCPEPKKRPRDEDDIDAADLLAASLGRRRRRG
jgi:hypothetical protein